MQRASALPSDCPDRWQTTRSPAPPDHGGAKLIDLGLARRLDDANDDLSACGAGVGFAAPGQRGLFKVQTAPGCAVGSPAYMAPEQVGDARSCSSAADTYSLGATWYVCVTGRMLFDASDPTTAMQQALAGDIRPPLMYAPGLPAAVDALIMWMLSKEPGNRPASGDGLVELIRMVLDTPHDAPRVEAVRAACQQQRSSAREAEWRSWVAMGVAALAFASYLLHELTSMDEGGPVAA